MPEAFETVRLQQRERRVETGARGSGYRRFAALAPLAAQRWRGGYVRAVSGDAHVRLPELIEGQGVVLKRWRESDAEALATAVTESAEHLRPWVAWMANEPLSVG